MKNQLQAGYAKVNINPPLGIGVSGYYVPRYAKGFLDDLEASVLALQCGEEQVVLISVDTCGIVSELVKHYCEAVEHETGIPKENILLAATHTHTGALLRPTEHFPVDEEKILSYAGFVGVRLADAVKMALADLKPARMGYITGRAPERVAYIRRYKMKDGSTWTCPPINDPNIDYPIGTLDQRVNVLRFEQETGSNIVLMNYGLHADTTNGDMLSADWPGWMRRTIEHTLGAKCIFFAGAEGDVGSTNVHPCGGDMNDTEISFDNEMKSPGMARFVGRALAGTILQVYDKAAFVDVDTIKMLHRDIVVPSNMPDANELPLAHKYKELHEAGRDEEIPYTGMQLTTAVADAYRMCDLENGPKDFVLGLTGVKIGPVVLVGIPGEPFTDIGVGIKETEGWSMILPCALANGNEGYFCMKSAYEEGGYEASTSRYQSGVAESIIAEAKELLNDLKK